MRPFAGLNVNRHKPQGCGKPSRAHAGVCASGLVSKLTACDANVSMAALAAFPHPWP